MALLLILLARQATLTKLEMGRNRLTDTQKQQIRDVVGQTAPSCEFDGEAGEEKDDDSD